jgi:hypothetical protein
MLYSSSIHFQTGRQSGRQTKSQANAIFERRAKLAQPSLMRSVKLQPPNDGVWSTDFSRRRFMTKRRRLESVLKRRPPNCVVSFNAPINRRLQSAAYSAPVSDPGQQFIDTAKVAQPSSITEQTTSRLKNI